MFVFGSQVQSSLPIVSRPSGSTSVAAGHGWRRAKLCDSSHSGISLSRNRTSSMCASPGRRAKLFEHDPFRWTFVEVLRQLRNETGFLLIGWVLMPEHFHLLIPPEPPEATSRFMQELKKRTAQRIIAALQESGEQPWHRRMLTRLRLPPSVQSDSCYRVWQRRFVPFNVFTQKKKLEKLAYMHNNPVKRRLVSSAERASTWGAVVELQVLLPE